MKLRKKYQDEDFDEGEVVEVLDIAYGADGTILLKADAKRGGRTIFAYKTLAEFNEEWEDALEEPKRMWAVGGFGELYEVSCLALNRIEKLKEIGNYFETGEEAEKAVEKLKTWKRLKDKGFRFNNFYRLNEYSCDIVASFNENWSELYDDLALLFGGEE